MPRRDYYALKLNEEDEAHIRAICVRMRVSPTSRGAYAKAIKFALKLVALGIVKEEDLGG